MYSNVSYPVVKTSVKKRKTNKKLSEFESFKKDAPEMPDFTCPYIDNANDHLHKATEELEELREMNSKLRDNAQFWKDSCEEMQNKLNEMRDWQKNLQNIVKEGI